VLLAERRGKKLMRISWVPKDADLEAEQADINEAEKAITEPETVAADANNHVETVIAAEKA
jgi:fructose-specific component phosphotransferase system IIB-like protein